MPTTVATSTANPVFGQPNLAAIDRDRNSGYLYVLVKGTTANVFEVYRSTDLGGSYSLLTSITRASVSEWSGIYVDFYGWLHWCYRTNESSEDRIYYRRLDLDTVTWTAELLVTSAGNGGAAGAVYTGMDVVAAVQPDQWFVAVAVATISGGSTGVTLFGVTAIGAGAPYLNNATFAGARQWLYTGSGRQTPAMSLEHTGDDKTNPTPHLWVAFGRGSLRMVKLAFNGWGWVGPSNHQVIEGTLASNHDAIVGRWSGNEWLMAVQDPANTSKVAIYERDRSNSVTTKRSSPTHTTGVIRTVAVNYDSSSRDIRVFAVGTSTAVLYYVTWFRASNTWSSWATVSATALLAIGQFNVRRSSAGNARHDVLTAHSTPTQIHTAQVLSYTPGAPEWEFAGAAYVNGGAADVNASLILDWTFTSGDPGDAQTAYAISRQIGAGALNYWRQSDSTWQTTEQKNTGATTSKTLASSWGAGTDANHTYKVKVWNTPDIASAYSVPLILVPSVKSDPTVTAPTAAQVITTATVTVTWTVSEQTQYQITLSQMVGGSPVPVYSTGWVTDAATRSLVLPYTMPDGFSAQLWMETRNLEGLKSTLITRDFSVDIVEPAAGTIVLSGLASQGILRATITNPAAVGSQPAYASTELWRRAAGVQATAMNPNPYFETNLTGWGVTGGTQVRDTGQFHQGVASNKLTPNGVATAVYSETDKFAVTQGVFYVVSAWIRPTTGNKKLTVYLHWFTSGDVYLVSTKLLTGPVATAWMFMQVAAMPDVAGPTAAKVSAAAGIEDTVAPGVGDIVWIDEVVLVRYDASLGKLVRSGLAANSVVDDWQAEALTDWEYRTRVWGANGAAIWGPWTR